MQSLKIGAEGSPGSCVHDCLINRFSSRIGSVEDFSVSTLNWIRHNCSANTGDDNMLRSAALFLALTFLSNSAFAAPANKPAQVMIVGMFHLSGSAHDLHNIAVPDVLQPKPQAEIVRIANALARFKPDEIAVEWDAPVVAERYPQYLAGTLKPSRNEVVQLGFRLGRMLGNRPVIGIDADGDFLWEPLKAYAETHGFSQLLTTEDHTLTQKVREIQRVLDAEGLPPALRRLNEPARMDSDNAWYRNLLMIGGGKQEPAVDLLTGWYRRNFQICANLIRIAKPGERIIVFFGAGHAFLLRQCVRETPALKLVEANDYLPR